MQDGTQIVRLILVNVILTLTRIRTKLFRSDVEKGVIAQAEGGDGNVADILSLTLITAPIRSAFCAFDFDCTEPNSFGRQIDAQSYAAAGITPLPWHRHSPQTSSRYVVLGEISHSPFTEYIFTDTSSVFDLFQHLAHR
jgi:hypothetical protein